MHTLVIMFVHVMYVLCFAVEFVLGMCGATMGTLISYILPAVFFIKVSASLSDGKALARVNIRVLLLFCRHYPVVDAVHSYKLYLYITGG